jgi:hypothetical protein
MNKDRNLQFCMDELQSMQKRDGLEPEQRSALLPRFQGPDELLKGYPHCAGSRRRATA